MGDRAGARQIEGDFVSSRPLAAVVRLTGTVVVFLTALVGSMCPTANAFDRVPDRTTVVPAYQCNSIGSDPATAPVRGPQAFGYDHHGLVAAVGPESDGASARPSTAATRASNYDRTVLPMSANGRTRTTPTASGPRAVGAPAVSGARCAANGGRTVAMGRNMADRVIPYARKNGYDWYKGTPGWVPRGAIEKVSPRALE